MNQLLRLLQSHKCFDFINLPIEETRDTLLLWHKAHGRIDSVLTCDAAAGFQMVAEPLRRMPPDMLLLVETNKGGTMIYDNSTTQSHSSSTSFNICRLKSRAIYSFYHEWDKSSRFYGAASFEAWIPSVEDPTPRVVSYEWDEQWHHRTFGVPLPVETGIELPPNAAGEEMLFYLEEIVYRLGIDFAREMESKAFLLHEVSGTEKVDVHQMLVDLWPASPGKQWAQYEMDKTTGRIIRTR